MLPKDTSAKTVHFVSFVKQTNNIMIVQKLDSSNGCNYASFILFGYGITGMEYHVKKNGIWF